MNHEELARRFVEGAEEGTGSRMFIDGDTIYSYGYHFPIAKRHRTADGRLYYLFNTNSYSSSTERHKSHVRNALEFLTNSPVIHIMGCNMQNELKQRILFKEAIGKASIKLSRARTEIMREHWNEDIQRNSRLLMELSEFAGLINLSSTKEASA